jgi:hypothetical protein
MEARAQNPSNGYADLARDTTAIADCMAACAACELECITCADACLKETDVAALRHCIRLDLDCADICGTTARLLARMPDGDARLLRSLIEACARACATCGAECASHAEEHEHCRRTAAACRACAEQCGRVLRELPDTHGLTHPPAGSTHAAPRA